MRASLLDVFGEKHRLRLFDKLPDRRLPVAFADPASAAEIHQIAGPPAAEGFLEKEMHLQTS